MDVLDLLAKNCDLTEQMAGDFRRLLDFYLLARERHNFTAIKEEEAFVVKHFVDSLLPLSLGLDFRSADRVLDLGTGGGFPGVPLALVRPEVNFVLLDGLKKNIALLTSLKNEFGLTNVLPIWERAEYAGRKENYREGFDWVVTRAFSDWSLLLESALPFLRLGGTLVAYKGPNDGERISDWYRTVKLLGGGDVRLRHYVLPRDFGARILVLITKKAPTSPLYPRRFSLMLKKPLHG